MTTDIDARYQAAEKLKDEGKLEESIAAMEAIVQEEPAHVLSHLALAVLYGRMGRHEDAIKHGQQACELEPTDPFSFTAMSVTYQRAWQGTQNHQYIHLAEEAMARSHALEGR
jgi:Flp pilus assembly protein TadD